MQEFIQSAVSRLGIGEDQAKSATGGLLNFLKEQGDGNDVQALIAKLPGAEGLMQSAGSSRTGGGGGMLGGPDLCRGPERRRHYARQKAGPDLVERVLAKVPALKALM